MPEKILIVEDEPSIAQGLAFALRQEGFQALVAATGSSGWTLLRQESPDLLLLDLMLPDADGIDFCRSLRAESHIPVLMLTARDQETDKVRGLDAGADDYITKPFSIPEVVARVRAALRRANTAVSAENRVVAGPILLDRDAHRVTVNGASVALRRREFDLLSALLTPPGRVRTREELLATVWEELEYVDPGTLDVHVRRLREKIEFDPAHPRHILTVRRVGYKFEP